MPAPPRPSPRLLPALAAAAALAFSAAPAPARAAACCLSASSFGIGRLLAWEDAAAGVRVGFTRSLGTWDQDGVLRWNRGGFTDDVTRIEPWAIYRVVPRLQLQAWAPVVVNRRAQDGRSQTAAGLGDVGAAARWEVLSIGEYRGLPAVGLTAGVLAPTGRRVEDTRPPLFAGTTGRGAWGGSLALEAEYAFLPWFVRAEGGLTLHAPFRRSDTGQTQRYGPIWAAGLSIGDELVADALVAALSVTGEWESSLSLDGQTVPGSRAVSYSLAASLSWRFDPRWTVVANLSNTVWPDGGGMNRDARLGFTLGVRRGYF